MEQALDAGHITAIGIGVIVALIVLGFLVGLIITAIIGRILIVLVVIVLGVLVWTQRTSIENKVDDHKCNLTFFGIHLDPPDSIKKQYCDARGSSG